MCLSGLSTGAIAILIAYTLTSLCYTPLMPLAETYALKGLAARGRAYGPVRLWGSFAFIFGNFAAGLAADVIPARNLIWLMVAASVLIALAAMGLPATLGQRAESNDAPSVDTSESRCAILRSSQCLQAQASFRQATRCSTAFRLLQWHAAGLDGTVIAVLWALGVAAEIVLFAVQARLPPFFSPTALLMVGAAAGVLRWLGMATDPSALVLPWSAAPACTVFRSYSSWGIDVSCAERTGRDRRRPRKDIWRSAAGLVMAAATGISGVLYQDFGSRAYVAMALVAFAGGTCGFVAHRTRRNATS